MLIRIQKTNFRADPPVVTTGPTTTIKRPLTTTDLQVHHYEVEIPSWKGPAFRIAHLSDFHVSDHLPMDYFCSVMEQANSMQPDLVFITGDFIAKTKYLPLLAQFLGKIHSRLGAYAILGNHDYWAGGREVSDIVQSFGIQLLGNGSRIIGMDGNGRLIIQGCELPWNKQKCDLPALQTGDMLLTLSHTADNIFRLSKAGATAVFSGHYHGGQFQLPVLGPLIVPSFYGRRFYHGHYLVDGTHLFVSAGVGADEPPLRIYCPPDIFVVDFRLLGQPPLAVLRHE